MTSVKVVRASIATGVDASALAVGIAESERRFGIDAGNVDVGDARSDV